MCVHKLGDTCQSVREGLLFPSPQCSDSELKLDNCLSGGSAFDVCAETEHVPLTQNGDGGELLGEERTYSYGSKELYGDLL